MECDVSDRVKPVWARNAHEYCSRKEESNKSNADNYSLISRGMFAQLTVTFYVFIRPLLTLSAAACVLLFTSGGGRGVAGCGSGWLKGFIGCWPRQTAAAFGDPPAVPISEDITCQQLPANG